MRTAPFALAALLFAGACVSSIWLTPSRVVASEVPCYEYPPPFAGEAPMNSCPNPFMQGIVDDQWIGVLIHWTGGNNGADSLVAFTVGHDRGAILTRLLGTIDAKDNYGWRGELEARFVHGKLWVINSFHTSGQDCHMCYTHLLVRAYGFYERNLHQQNSVIIPCHGGGKGSDCPSADEAIAEALHPRFPIDTIGP
jgi:hypothetical protein